MDSVGKSLVLAMFLYSGIDKVANPEKDMVRLQKKTGFESKELIIFIGIFEMVASLHAFYSSDNHVSVAALSVFTVLATLIFYSQPMKPYQFLSNASTLGGLLLMRSSSLS